MRKLANLPNTTISHLSRDFARRRLKYIVVGCILAVAQLNSAENITLHLHPNPAMMQTTKSQSRIHCAKCVDVWFCVLCIFLHYRIVLIIASCVTSKSDWRLLSHHITSVQLPLLLKHDDVHLWEVWRCNDAIRPMSKFAFNIPGTSSWIFIQGIFIRTSAYNLPLARLSKIFQFKIESSFFSFFCK